MSADILVILENFARDEAACSDDRLVDSPRFIITSVKSVIFSVAIPSCPADSATPAISVVEDGITRDISFISLLISASCSSVPSTVLYTPVTALSNSIAALAAETKPSFILFSAATTPIVAKASWISSPALAALFPKVSLSPEAFCNASPYSLASRSDLLSASATFCSALAALFPKVSLSPEAFCNASPYSLASRSDLLSASATFCSALAALLEAAYIFSSACADASVAEAFFLAAAAASSAFFAFFSDFWATFSRLSEVFCA